MTNNNPLLPYTINTALVSPALARPNSDVTARVTAMNYTFTSRPVTSLWFSARYRQYEFDNRTVPFETGNSVNYDTAIVALNAESEPFGSTRHTFDADATYSPVRYFGFRAGYTREDVDRTYRIVEKTTEDIGRVSVDLTGLGWMTVRGVFEHSKRSGLGGRRAGAAGDRRAADAAAVRHLGSRPGPLQRDREVMPVSQFSVNAIGRHRPAGVPGHQLRAAQQRQPRLLGRVRLRPVGQGVARRELRLRAVRPRCRRRGPPTRCRPTRSRS